MIVGTVAIRGVHLPLEPPALQEFEAVCEMFESAAQSNIRAALATVRDYRICDCDIPNLMRTMSLVAASQVHAPEGSHRG